MYNLYYPNFVTLKLIILYTEFHLKVKLLFHKNISCIHHCQGKRIPSVDNLLYLFEVGCLSYFLFIRM